MFRIDIQDMYLRDERALNILHQHCNPQTCRAEITLKRLSQELRCDPATTWRILKRLEGSGHIKRHPHRGPKGIDIEVFATDEQPSA